MNVCQLKITNQKLIKNQKIKIKETMIFNEVLRFILWFCLPRGAGGRFTL